MTPAHLSTTEDDLDDIPTAQPFLTWWVRAVLLLIVVGLTAVFTIAVLLNPYNADGSPKTMATHTGPPLNLPDCTFKTMTGLPCPSCGMTTSFSLLMHGDPLNSMRANWVGTGLAVFCLALIPWALASVWLKRPLFVKALDRAMAYAVVTFLVVMLLRWGVVLLLIWRQRHDS